MTARFPLVLVNGYPQEISRTDRVANSGNIARGPNQPGGTGTAVDGDLWYDTGNAQLKIWDGSTWASVSGSGGGAVLSFRTLLRRRLRTATCGTTPRMDT